MAGESYGSSGATGGGGDQNALMKLLFSYLQQQQQGGGAQQGNAPTSATASIGSELEEGGNKAMMTGNPYAMAAGAAAKVAGKGMKIYSAYKAAKRARDQENAASRRNAMLDRVNFEELERDRKQEQLSNAFKGGEYAQGLGKNIWENYGRYN